MISKDVASIIAKYNKPTIFGIEYLGKYFTASSEDDLIKRLFDNRYKYNWIQQLFLYSTQYYGFGNPRCTIHYDYCECKRESCIGFEKFDNIEVWYSYIKHRITKINIESI